MPTYICSGSVWQGGQNTLHKALVLGLTGAKLTLLISFLQKTDSDGNQQQIHGRWLLTQGTSGFVMNTC